MTPSSMGSGLFTLPRLIKSGTDGMNKELQLQEVMKNTQTLIMLYLIKNHFQRVFRTTLIHVTFSLQEQWPI